MIQQTRPQRKKSKITILLPLLCTVFLVSHAIEAGSDEANLFKARLNGVEIWIDSQSGGLVRMTSPNGKTLVEAAPAGTGLLDVAYPIHDFTPLRLATRFSKAQVLQVGDSVKIKWATLGPSRVTFALPKGKVSAEVLIKPAPDGKSLIFSCRIENQSEGEIPQILFPDLWGMTPSNGVADTHLRLARGAALPFQIPFKGEESAPPYYNRVGWKQYSAGGYYEENALRWLDFGGRDGGLSVFQRKWGTSSRPDVLTYRSERDPWHLRLAWQHKNLIRAGETWESGEFWFTPHEGGWAKGIEPFRTYVEEVNPVRSGPAHVRDGLGFQSVWMTQTPEQDPKKVYFRYQDLLKVSRDALQNGLDELVPWFWSHTYFTLPIQSSPMLGTEAELLASIRESKTLGVNVAPFVSIHIILNNEVRRYGVEPSHDDWTYHPELLPQFRPYYAHDLEGTFVDDDNQRWQQDTKAALMDWVQRGMHSLSFDQFIYKQVPGEKPGLMTAIEPVKALAVSKDPESTFSGESVTNLEMDSPILDYTWNWVDHVDAGPMVNVLRWPRLNCNIDASAMAAKKCFAEGLYLNAMPSLEDEPNGTALISQRPLLAEALKEASAMRRRFLPYFVEGHAMGDSFLSQSASGFVRAYQRGNKLLVLVLNHKAETQKVTVQSLLNLWLPKSKVYKIRYFEGHGKWLRDSTWGDAHWRGTTDSLRSGEMAAFEIN